MGNSISIMQSDITDKNSRIAQLDTINTRLYTNNNHLTELCIKGKLFDKEERSEERGGKRETEEHNEQRNRQKCLWHEKSKCNREDCKFCHPRKVCKNYNQEN